jgi:hypothetical protein
MAVYRYTFLDRNGRVEADFALCWPSDEIATELAIEMLASSGFTSLEMREGSELIYRVGQTDADLSVERRLRSWCGVLPSDFPLSSQTRSTATWVDTGNTKNTVVLFQSHRRSRP